MKMLDYDQYAALGVFFVALFIALMAVGLLLVIKEAVKDKVDWWHRKWRTESRLDELECRVGELEKTAHVNKPYQTGVSSSREVGA